ncbi:DUF2934 domain-containing protein, partial [Mesorhizobium sp.]|uniref:DUF2934 domain-containing protein n=1 Tax=Mesorhizobium sp. TaxID=1871066 RepID=UPI00257B0C39
MSESGFGAGSSVAPRIDHKSARRTQDGRRTARKKPTPRIPIWEREGSRHGDHERHWHQAKAEID